MPPAILDPRSNKFDAQSKQKLTVWYSSFLRRQATIFHRIHAWNEICALLSFYIHIIIYTTYIWYVEAMVKPINQQFSDK